MKRKINKFALIGASGFIAPKHMAAIKHNSGQLTVALDPNDSVGIIDRYFPECFFFTKLNKFIDYLRKKEKVNFLIICSPNHLHYRQIKAGLNNNINIICEKPLVLKSQELTSLENLIKKKKKKIYVIMQLRYHPPFIKLKKKLKNSNHNNKVEITYIASRGNWYNQSWKGDHKKSGGIIFNIGVHIFDILVWLFGNVEKSELYISKKDVASGFIKFQNTEVKWFLSTNSNYLPKSFKKKSIPSMRSIIFNKKNIEFSKGLENLHTNCYKDFLDNKGYELNDFKKCLELINKIKNSKISNNKNNYHPFIPRVIND